MSVLQTTQINNDVDFSQPALKATKSGILELYFGSFFGASLKNISCYLLCRGKCLNGYEKEEGRYKGRKGGRRERREGWRDGAVEERLSCTIEI